MSSLECIFARSNVEQLSHALLAQQQATGQGEGARVFGLDRTRLLLTALGNPHTRYRIVHVAGSKGKGSVCEMVASGLMHANVCTGLFTSPHVLHLRERFRVSNTPASDTQLEHLAHAVLQAEADCRIAFELQSLGQATHFELLVAMALLHFAEQAVDVAVIEVGLGGLFDATNVVLPGSQGVCILTSIQHEHTQLLGNTLAQIAAHKAGILKPSTPAISSPQHQSVRSVFRAASERAETALRFLGEDIAWEHREVGFRDSAGNAQRTHRISVSHAGTTCKDVRSPLPGVHMALNTALALAACMQLHATGLLLDMRRCEQGIEHTHLPARLELASAGPPRVVIDGAHTPDSVRATLAALPALYQFDSLAVIFGCAGDKDAAGIARELCGGADKVFVTQTSQSPRAASPASLRDACLAAGVRSVLSTSTLQEALSLARSAATARDMILVVGSFALAGEAKRLLSLGSAGPHTQYAANTKA